ncbi:MAG: hypothetical protein WDA15_01105 [Trueperaceae bacterium]|jgi:hypothetical protein
MFVMLYFRVVAAFVALQLFATTVLLPAAGPWLGMAVGVLAAVVVYAVGRSVVRSLELPPGPPEGMPRGIGTGWWLGVAAGATFTAVGSFHLVISNPGGVGRWTSVISLIVGLVVLWLAASTLNRFAAAREA